MPVASVGAAKPRYFFRNSAISFVAHRNDGTNRMSRRGECSLETTQVASEQPATNSFLIVLARFFWIQLGPMILLILAFNIAWRGSGWFTALDFVFLGILAVLILARWAEFRGGQPLTSTGEPATRDHLRRYAIGSTVAGLGTWAFANLLGNHFIPR